jgi:hypothetical protein
MRRLRTATGATLVDLIFLWIGTLRPTTEQGFIIRAVAGLVVAWAVLETVQSRRFRAWLSFEVRSPFIRKADRPRTPKIVAKEVELGFLDFELNSTKAATAVSKLLVRLTKELGRGARDTQASSKQLATVSALSVARRRGAANLAASRINAHAQRLERLEEAFRKACGDLSSNSLGWVETAPATSGWAELDKSFETLANVSSESRGGSLGYRQAVQQNRELRVTQGVNKATERLLVVLDRLLEDNDSIIAYCEEARSIVERRAPALIAVNRRSPRRTKHDPSPRQPSQESEGKD